MLSLLGVVNATAAVAFILASRSDIREALVAYMNRTLAEMTFKRAIFFAAAVIVAVMAFEVLPFEMALPLFLDAFTYIDMVAAVYFALANRHVRAWGRIAGDQLNVAARKLFAGLHRGRPLSAFARCLRQARPRLAPKASEDDDGGWANTWRYAV